MSLRLVLMGTGEFALPTFRSLMTGPDHQVVGVFTQPDREGRGHHRHVNKVKELAEQQGVPVFQPQRVNRPEVLQQLRDLNADVFVVAAYGQILKPDLLSIPRLGAFNLHGSLLPRHRGAAPVQYSIWKGDQKSGVTMFQIEPALDSGPMVGKVETDILPQDTSATLMERLAVLSIELTHRVLHELDSATATFEVQDEVQVTLAPKISREDGLIEWTQSANEIDWQVRAMQPWPKASTWLHTPGQAPLRCIILSVQCLPQTSSRNATAGQIQRNGRQVCVTTGDGLLELLTIQPEGRKAVDAASFVNGYGLSDSSAFRNSDT